MRRLVFALALLTGAVSAQGVVGDDGIYVVVDTPPAPVGGMAALAERVVYPEAALADRAEGVVFVTFVVAPDGSAQDVSAPRAPHPALGEAAVAAVSGHPFTPGQADGKPVPTRFSLPIRFQLPSVDVAYADQPAEPLGGWRRFVESIDWPSDARYSEIEATFYLVAEIDPTGHVIEAAVEVTRKRGSRQEIAVSRVEAERLTQLPSDMPRTSTVIDAMEAAILEAARATRFTPEIRDGEAIHGRVSVTLPFIARS